MVTNKTRQARGVSHCGLVIYILKNILKAKEELSRHNYVRMQKYIFQKIF
jgi:hypothetical protein